MSSRLTRIVTVAALAGAAALAAPALASASVYCVGDAGGACDVSKTGAPAGLQSALSDAAASAEDDIVRIGAGTYAGNFSYASASEVDIEGAGAATVIQGVGDQPALSMSASGGAATVSGVTIQMASVPKPQAAVGLRIGPGTADGVRVENPGDSLGTGVVLQPGGDVLASAILARGATGIDEDGAPSQHEVRDTLIRAFVGVRARAGAWDLERLQITATHGGVASYAATSVRNSLVRVSGVGDVSNSSFGVLQGAQGLLAVRHATIYAGPLLSYGAWVRNLEGQGTASIDMRNSIVAGPFAGSTFARYASAGGTANVAVGHSNFVPPMPASIGDSQGSGSFQHAPSASNNAMPPRFVDPLVTLDSPGLDLRLRHDSPLIDRGESGDPTTAPGRDVAGEARLVDGDGDHALVYDMGAHEYQRRPPVAVIAAPPGGRVAAGAPVAFSAEDSRDPDAGDTLSYAWRFGDGTSATGKSVTRAYASGGARTVTLTVTDSTGLTDTTTVPLQVDPPPAPPGTGPGPIAGTGPRDRVAPVVSLASLSRPVFAVTGRVPAGRRGARVRFTLSEPASVRFTIARRAVGRRVGGACRTANRRNRAHPRCVRWAAAGSITRHASAGANGVRLAGRLRVRGRIRSLAPGRYRLTLVATDAAGNRSIPTRLPFRVARQPA
jgi:hypothetical protein